MGHALLALRTFKAGGSSSQPRNAANTIGSADIINNSVRSIDVQNEGPNGGGLVSADLAENAVGVHQFQYGVLQARPHVDRFHGDQDGHDQGACGVLPPGRER